ncbi:ABATE domain-containing protein [Streptomyces sp. VRA16 Mangrove soil]|uniref:CGNR zinc finger domain-containing protein n=1 Tax=Streptomyces sp. VRA16 Mangrove soil TaxID=2817434 RepID=UPI001A9F67B4|nr:ABATE domain-containing protein [Streptomyces sp. VRA16 Mangrove soil]MBO1329833.1 ABATE domain-containing protein [Streptomyces sp. VRA16 Mangrove soil]
MNHAFPCGTLPLDFVGTLRARRNELPTEKLATPDLLDDWFVESGMVDEPPRADEVDLETAIDLREAIYSLVAARLAGESLPGADVAEVNRQAAGLPVKTQLVEGQVRHTASVSQALATLARHTIEIVGGDEAALLRECARPECTQVYLDRSRGHRREWCAMRTCGNRVKAAAYRARKSPAGA